jgi:hypothetical protein
MNKLVEPELWIVQGIVAGSEMTKEGERNAAIFAVYHGMFRKYGSKISSNISLK